MNRSRPVAAALPDRAWFCEFHRCHHGSAGCLECKAADDVPALVVEDTPPHHWYCSQCKADRDDSICTACGRPCVAMGAPISEIKWGSGAPRASVVTDDINRFLKDMADAIPKMKMTALQREHAKAVLRFCIADAIAERLIRRRDPDAEHAAEMSRRMMEGDVAGYQAPEFLDAGIPTG